MAGVQIRDRAHEGLNHEKAVLLTGQDMVIFGSSNWTSPSSDSQEEHNYFATKPSITVWFRQQFERKWNNTAGQETKPFQPLPPTRPPISNRPLARQPCPQRRRSYWMPGRSRTCTTSISEPCRIRPCWSTISIWVPRSRRRRATIRASTSAAQHGLLLAGRGQDDGSPGARPGNLELCYGDCCAAAPSLATGLPQRDAGAWMGLC